MKNNLLQQKGAKIKCIYLQISTARVLKTRIVTTLAIIFNVIYSFAQNPGDPAKFDIRGNVYSGTPTTNVDDWFKGATGFGMIDESNTVLFQNYTSNLTNIPFLAGPSFAPYSLQNGVILYDALFARDYSSALGNDQTTFSGGGSKNGNNPMTDWNISSGSVPNKADIINVYAHVRRNGTSVLTGDLWLNLALTVDITTGNRFIDFELFKQKVAISGSSFINSGTDEGHTAWTFDSSGNILTTGDAVVGISLNGSSVNATELRIWVKKSDFSGPTSITPTTFTWGSSIDGGGTYGYASVNPPAGSFFTQVNTSANSAAPWGTISGGVYSTTSSAGSLAEVGLNLTTLGVDPRLGSGANACASAFSRLIVKTRSSSSFSSTLQDFAGPYPFLDFPAVDTSIINPGPFKCTSSELTLSPTNPGSNYYVWTTTDGLFSNGTQTFVGNTAVILKAGTYTLTGSQILGCTTSSSSITVGIAPCSVSDINQVPQGVTAIGNVLTNDTNATGTLAVQSATYLNAAGIFTALPMGTATNVYNASGVLAGTITLNANGTYTFVPTASYTGKVPVKYVAVNADGYTDSAELIIVVIKNPTGGNNSPIAQNDTSFTEINIPVTVNILANDSDPDGNTLTIVSANQGGTALTVGVPVVVSGVDSAGNAVTNAGTALLNVNGTITYTPSVGFLGFINSITYTISDGNGGTATAIVNITVLPNSINNTFANDDANTAIVGTTLTGNILTNDTDPEGNIQTVSSATAGGIVLPIGTATIIPGVGSLILNANGNYTFVPVATYVGTTNVVYTTCDNGVPQACDTATLYLTELSLGVCYNLPNTSTAGSATQHGITLLQRAGGITATDWPMVRNSAFTALESNSKGFVITRMTTAQINAIAFPQEGMMVFDSSPSEKCLKIYSDGVWSCFKTPACP